MSQDFNGSESSLLISVEPMVEMQVLVAVPMAGCNLRFRALVCSQGHCVAAHRSLVLANEENLSPNTLS